ncbi:MAG: nitronate monooxygenase [Solirubrobacteraceae bacterium]|nr:nitronate monooxygenase [Solirubrobacteraceae bacterium]
MSTRFTELIGCDLPLQLAPMGGVGTSELAAAVAHAGGLGMVPNGGEAPPGACGVNFLLPFDPSLDAVREAAARSRVVEFFYDDPRPDLVSAVHDGGALAGWQVGSAAEAAAAEECGCDYVAVQGIEAGGHVRGTEPLDEVLPRARESVRVPLLAAGGVTTAERFAELLRMGADGVRVGTRFVVAHESGAHPEYVDSVLGSDGDTVLTEWFDEGWESAPHRVLSAALDAAQQSGWRRPVPPYRDIDRPPSDMAMYAGTGVGQVSVAQPAAEIVADLVRLI